MQLITHRKYKLEEEEKNLENVLLHRNVATDEKLYTTNLICIQFSCIF